MTTQADTPKIRMGYSHFDPRLSLFWAMLRHYVLKEATHLNITLIEHHVTSIDAQARAIESMLPQIDVLLFKPIISGDENLINIIEQVTSRGIPVLALDSSVGGGGVLSTIRSDNLTGQALIAEHMFKSIGGEGKVAYIGGDPKTQSAVLRSQGLHNVLQRYPNIELVFESALDWGSPIPRHEKGRMLGREALTAHPDLKAVVSASDDSVLGVIETIAEFGLTQNIKVCGFDAIPDALVAIQEGKMEATIRQSMDLIVKRAFATALDGLAGKPVEPDIAIEVNLVTRENITLAALPIMQIIPEIMRDLVRRGAELEQANSAIRENQQKLVTAEKMASLGRLTAGIAHEMNTPIAAVRSALSELGKLVDEYDQAIDDPDINNQDHHEIAVEMGAAIKLATGAAERAAGFVRSVKSQTRDLSAKQLEQFNVVPIIHEAILLLSHALRQGACTVAFEPCAETFNLYGSPPRLAQILTNILGNAIDACRDNGGGVIIIELAVKGSYLELKISDNGCGIEPDILPKVFDPMFTTKPFGQGTGLGLSIVHDIVTSDFAGTVVVDSKLGEGTTFTLRLASPKDNILESKLT